MFSRFLLAKKKTGQNVKKAIQSASLADSFILRGKLNCYIDLFPIYLAHAGTNQKFSILRMDCLMPSDNIHLMSAPEGNS